MNLEKELSLAKIAVNTAGNYLKNLSDRGMISNEGRDTKLKADRGAESIISKLLSGTYPIIAEEKGKNPKNSGIRWIVDPNDGTANYFLGIPFSAVSIALWRNMEPLLGVVYDYNHGDLFSGSLEHNVNHNGFEMLVSDVSEKSKGIFSTGFPPSMDYSDGNLLKIARNFRDYKKTRLLGCPSLSLAYVAAGKFTAYHENPVNFWDVAAGLALVKFAGGKFEMKDLGNGKYDVFASNGKISR